MGGGSLNTFNALNNLFDGASLLIETAVVPRRVGEMKGAAIFSKDRKRRYLLMRVWDEGLPVVAFGMLNPSDAGAEKNDMTVRKGIGFATRWGFGGIVAVNLIPVIATEPWDLPYWDGIYEDNDVFLIHALNVGPMVVAWGTVPAAVYRKTALSEHILRFRDLARRKEMFCIGLTHTGAPRHPSRAAYTAAMERFDWHG